MAARLLKPLGNPPPNGTKYFGTEEVRSLARNAGWLARMTNAIHLHWWRKHQNKTGPSWNRHETSGPGQPPGSPHP